MRPSARTASMCTAEESARITHSFKVVGGMLHRGFGVGNSVRSAAFAAGGPRRLISKPNVEATTVLYDFRLVNQVSGLSSSVFTNLAVFNAPKPLSWGRRRFMKKSDLEALGYLKDDCLEIECDLTMIKVDEIDAPHSDMVHGLGKLLESEEAADATFKVQGEVFRAHRLVLAMRSPVFRAEFYGPFGDKRKEEAVVVEDMEPPVFKALLHFIYTDSLPTMDDLDCHEYEEMAKHLLVAADRYGMERMKLISKLKDACIRFINFSNRKDAVAASQGYEHLKTACPTVVAEIWGKPAKSRKI
ncbi:hypothetical protein BS78_K171300 [Paspalum vaginatum]|uniref:BTB domain-containing protein n=1 Tax=Paspalum vaginatum TaxID=158149 RepID=A0A9W8CFF7_9POAL|nr:hypothetical protein BS78_K171300 [Paspalum vaginatum]